MSVPGPKHLSLLFFIISLLPLSLSAIAAAEEKSLTLATGTQAIYSLPKKPHAAVLLIHGWADHMDGVGNLNKRLAASLAEQGIASLRVNMRGESEREKTNYRLTSTFASRIEDSEAGLAFLQKTNPQLPLGIVGFSLGGSTALAVTGRNASSINSLVLWSTALHPDAVISNPLYADAYREALTNGEAVIPAWVDLTITREHIVGMLGYDVLSGLKEYRGALLSIRGSEDYLPRHEDTIMAAASGIREEFRIIGGADHIFQTLDPNSVYDEIAIDATTDWLVDTLIAKD